MIAFIDVAGDAYSSPEKSPWVALHIVCIRQRSIYDITNRFYSFKRDILENEYIEIKSTDLINKSTLSHPELQKTKFLERIMHECIDHADCKHASIAFKNSGCNRKSDENHLPKHYVDALWRIEVVARQWHVNNAVVVIDNNTRNIDRKLAFAFNNYIYRTYGGNNVLQHVLPVPIFADSVTTTGIQLADISAGIVRNYHTEKPTWHKDAVHLLESYYSMIENRSIRSYQIDGFHIRGFYVPNKKYIL